jgi:hypothetical protein
VAILQKGRLSASRISAIAVVVQNQNAPKGGLQLYTPGWYDGAGQQFTLPSGSNVVLIKCSFLLKKVGNPTGLATARLYLYNPTSQLPTTLLATSNGFDISTLTTIGVVWVTFTFSGANQYVMTPGTPYVIGVFVPSSGTDSSDYVVYSYTSVISGLGWLWFHQAPTTWSYTSAFNMDFIVYGRAV